jgi:hypothetical protein
MSAQSKLTADVATKICEHLEKAVPFQYAAAAAGISKVTAYEWLRRGRSGNRRYAAFAAAVEIAQAKAVCDLHVKLLKGSKGAVRGVIFLLERLYPTIYGPNVPPDNADREPLEILQRRLDPMRVPVDRDGRFVG